MARAALGAAILLAGAGLYAHVVSKRGAEDRPRLEAPRHIATPPPRPSSARDEGDGIGALIGASTDRSSDPVPTQDERAGLDALINSTAVRHADETPARAAAVKAPVPEKPAAIQRDPALEMWFIKAYLRCWTPPATLPQGEKYAAQIRVVHNSDGSLAAPPHLVNPPDAPEWRAYAESAVHAVAKCNPLQVPARYLAHFDQWRKLTLHFSPDSAL